jgi:chromosome segregation ATPase
MMGGGKFRYSLNALLRKRRSEFDTVMAELAEASAQRERRRQELGRDRASLQGLEDLQRTLCRQGHVIDVDARMRVHLCIHAAVVQVNERIKELERADARFETLLGRVSAARQAVRALEDHRDSRRRLFDAACMRRDHAIADELYLANQQSRHAPGEIWQ